MSNPKFTNRKLVVAHSPDFMVQPAHGVAIATANLNARHPQTTPAFHSVIPFREEQRDCSGMFVIKEELTGKIARFLLGFTGTAKQFAGWFALLQGLAALPTGTPANEQQTIDLGGATGGEITLGLDFEGLADDTGAFAVGAATTAAEIKAYLETIRPIKRGNVNVTGSAGGPFTAEFTGALAKANLPLLSIVDATTGGTGATVSASVDGANKLHLISRSSSDYPALFSLIEGFNGETGGTKKFKDFVMNSWTATVNRRGKASLTVEAFGDPTADILNDYVMPACSTPAPIDAKYIRLSTGQFGYITNDLRELTVTESNNIDVSEDAIRGDDITPDQLQSGDPTASVNALFLGSPTSDLFEFAEDENDAFDSLRVDFGVPGERFSYIAADAQFRLDDSLVEFTGSRNVSAFRVLARPNPVGSAYPSRGEYRGAFNGQFLLSE